MHSSSPKQIMSQLLEVSVDELPEYIDGREDDRNYSSYFDNSFANYVADAAGTYDMTVDLISPTHSLRLGVGASYLLLYTEDGINYKLVPKAYQHDAIPPPSFPPLKSTAAPKSSATPPTKSDPVDPTKITALNSIWAMHSDFYLETQYILISNVSFNAEPDHLIKELNALLAHHNYTSLYPIGDLLRADGFFILRDEVHRMCSAVIELTQLEKFGSSSTSYMDHRPMLAQYRAAPRDISLAEGRGTSARKANTDQPALLRATTYYIQPISPEQYAGSILAFSIGAVRKLSSNIFTAEYELLNLIDFFKQEKDFKITARTIFQVSLKMFTYPAPPALKAKAKKPIDYVHKGELTVTIWHDDHYRNNSNIIFINVRGLPYEVHPEFILKRAIADPRILIRITALQITNLTYQIPVIDFLNMLLQVKIFNAATMGGVYLILQTQQLARDGVTIHNELPVDKAVYVIVFNSDISSISMETYQAIRQYLIVSGNLDVVLTRLDTLTGRDRYLHMFPSTPTLPVTPASDAWSNPAPSGTPSTLSSNASTGHSVKRTPNPIPLKLFSPGTTAEVSEDSVSAEAIKLEKEIAQRQEQLSKLKRDSSTKPFRDGKK
jgi:hypothetical protein